MGDSDSPAPYRNDSASLKIPRVALYNLGEQSDAFLCGRVWQANQPRVRSAAQIDQLPEIGVDGDKDSVRRRRQFQQCRVAGVCS